MIPFTGHLREMADNLLVFIPFGLLLGVNFKQIAFWQKLIVVSFFSIAIEAIQFIFAIGVTDITDVIMNTFGGLSGLALYAFGRKRVNPEKLDHFINIAGVLLIVLFLTLRIFVFRVKY
jgi:glycopeptide antibiotics resistance protein